MVGTTLVPVRYVTLPATPGAQLGAQLMLSFWAWGKSEADVMENLDRVMRNVAVAMRSVVREVPVISPGRILELLPPPYDLIKVDIEGGEHDLLTGYQEVLKHTGTMLFEWHSWHGGGGGLPQLRRLAADLGFTRQQEFKTPHQAPAQGTDAECGVLLLQRETR